VNATRVREIRELSEQGMKGCDIAKRVGVSASTVSRILKRKGSEEGDASEGVAKAVAGHSD
jgi:predicted transcriptional regulator